VGGKIGLVPECAEVTWCHRNIARVIILQRNFDKNKTP